MGNLRDRIESFDYENANTSDLAVLLEQIFMYHDTRARDGGPVIVSQRVLERWGEAVRRRAAPELHTRVRGSCVELRSTVDQLGTLLARLEKGSSRVA